MSKYQYRVQENEVIDVDLFGEHVSHTMYNPQYRKKGLIFWGEWHNIIKGGLYYGVHSKKLAEEEIERYKENVEM
jgi:hypothetical protein